MTNTTQDRGALKYVICPDVPDLPDWLKPGDKLEVLSNFDGFLHLRCEDGREPTTSLTKSTFLKGADWICIYENDVIQGFGDYKMRGGCKFTINKYTANNPDYPWRGARTNPDQELSFAANGNWVDDDRGPMDIIGPWLGDEAEPQGESFLEAVAGVKAGAKVSLDGIELKQLDGVLYFDTDDPNLNPVYIDQIDRIDWQVEWPEPAETDWKNECRNIAKAFRCAVNHSSVKDETGYLEMPHIKRLLEESE